MIFVSLEGEKLIRCTRGNEVPGVECLLGECDSFYCVIGVYAGWE